jgi:hypothetical protein
MCSDAHEGVRSGVPDDDAAGGVHDEGVGNEVLTISRHSVLTHTIATCTI